MYSPIWMSKLVVTPPGAEPPVDYALRMLSMRADSSTCRKCQWCDIRRRDVAFIRSSDRIRPVARRAATGSPFQRAGDKLPQRKEVRFARYATAQIEQIEAAIATVEKQLMAWHKVNA
jgi:hypothetical protein